MASADKRSNDRDSEDQENVVKPKVISFPKRGSALEEAKRKGREAVRKHFEEEKIKQQQLQQQQQPAVNEDEDDSDVDYLFNQLTKMTFSNKPDLIEGTGLVYDEKQTAHKHLWDPDFPERPERITEPFKRCYELGLVDRCVRIPIQYGTEDQVLLQHAQELLDKIKSTTSMSKDELAKITQQYDSVFFNNSTYECALLSLGSVVELMEQILKKTIRNGLAIVRPPGHHAMNNEFCGYCIFNNVAIAAKHAVDNLGLKRVLIVDFDVHHGQATQYMFYDDPRVLYFSIHRYEHGEFWPNLRESDYDFIGEGDGKGYNINVPLNKTGMKDSDYLAIFHQILMPVAHQFNPELVLVSAGYDQALGCFEGEMEVTPVAYSHFIHKISSLAQGRVCVALEGGYCIKSLSEGVALTLRSLLGDPCPPLPPTEEPSDSVTESILNVIKVLQDHWSCFQYQEILEEGEICQFEGVDTMPPKSGVVFTTPENRPTEYPLEDYIYSEKVREIYIDNGNNFDPIIDALIAETSLAVPPNRTCLAYDDAMRAHKNKFMYGHPEDPDRITCIYDKHVEWGLTDRCFRIQCRLATEAELQLVHSATYVDMMESTALKNPLQLREIENTYNSVYMCAETYYCAKMSCGYVLNVVDKVLSGEAQNGVAIVRPPGHHAECTKAMGFCFFNNIAIAAKFAKSKYNIKRILILDWDVHHGNGTQNAFYEDPSVLLISLHRYENGFFYPTSNDGNYDRVGRGKGEGFNVNIPWNNGNMGDAEYIAAFQQIVMPIAYEFSPELVLVSAGFDAAMGDPLGMYQITPEGYGHMTHMLSTLANGRVVLALEGGYHLEAISYCMCTCTSVLLGDACPYLPYAQPKDSAIECMNDVLDTQKKYWKSLKFRVAIPDLYHKKLEDKVKKETEGSESKETSTSNVLVGSLNEAIDDLKSTQDLIDKTKTLLASVSKNSSKPKPNLTMSDQKDQGKTNTTESGSGEPGGSGGASGGTDPWSSRDALVGYLESQGVEQMFAVQPKPWCPHLETLQPLPPEGLNTKAVCADQSCGDGKENWVCLVCYQVYCSRFVNEHMLMHGISTGHLLTLSYSDLSVWCYGCEDYIDNEVLKPAKRAAHKDKFGQDIPG